MISDQVRDALILAPLADYRTKTQIIVDTVRAQITSGEWAPGERLVIRTLAQGFDCSDIPVREALRTLASEGLVVIVPHGGARVSELDGRELVELTEARALIEPAATVAAAQAMPEGAVAVLRAMLDTMRRAKDELDDADYGRLNREFHHEILRHCPNRTLVGLIEDLWDRAERGRAVFRFFEGHKGTSLAQHEEIVRRIELQDFDGLKRVSERHSAHALAAIRRLVDDAQKSAAETRTEAAPTASRSKRAASPARPPRAAAGRNSTQPTETTK